MSGKFVRASKYRHVHGEVAKKELQYSSIRPATSGDGDFVTASETHFAFATTGGGGPVVVHKVGQYGRLAHSPPVVNVHKSKVLDMEFSPFIPNMLAMGSDDCTASVVLAPPEGMTANINKADATLHGHQKKVSFVHFNPAASNILGTCSYDHTIKIWDIEAQAEVLSSEPAEDSIQSFGWNGNGSLIGASYKDKTIAVYDPRSKEAPAHHPGLAGSKPSRFVWLDNHNLVACLGFGGNAGRVVGIWDPRDLSKKLGEVEIDQQAGVMMPFYDPDTSILYIGGKGDGNIRYFEVVNEAPYLFFLSEFRSNESQKGMCFLPKRAVDVSKCEIGMCYRLMREAVEPVSFQVPRKSDVFQEDIFPDCYAGIPALDAAAWLEGKNGEPQKRSLKPGTVVETAAATFTAKKSPQELEQELDSANARIAELEALLKANSIDVPASK